jgi:hypothetical protein
MKKIMEKRFMFVGTLEEAEFNRVVCFPIPYIASQLADGSSRVVIGIMVR